jgi:hypothetical protein
MVTVGQDKTQDPEINTRLRRLLGAREAVNGTTRPLSLPWGWLFGEIG